MMHRVAVIPGDGIGKEVVPEGIRVLDAAGRRFNIRFQWEHFPWGCEYYASHGQMMPPDGLDLLKGFEAIYLGAVGHPEVPDHVSLWGLLIPIRRTFRQYINLRPVRLLRGIESPLRDKKPNDIDLCVVRENNEGEYSNIGGRMYAGTEQEMTVQASIFTRKGVEKVIRFAFELAAKRPKRHLTSATKSNGIVFTMPYWDEIFRDISKEYPGVKADQYHIDGLTAALVLRPERFDVLVGSNLFGDILSDLTPALAGSLGIAPSGNLNPEKEFPSMFEPVHGSAPDIAGKGIANPIGQIWSGAMMLEHLGHPEAAGAIEEAIEAILGEGKVRTPDLGGNSTTEDAGRAVVEYILKYSS
ncbi:MAG: D-malate dehydrogenase (decarboxylating) [Syntrophorhabdus sp. PtaU1.Bin058]|nr:MAG: D-malate dehydrogenase (decarboxylating) [Syntrophorhabdus sp. PtaU1.Bin058]